jgi:hypothetical protein
MVYLWRDRLGRLHCSVFSNQFKKYLLNKKNVEVSRISELQSIQLYTLYIYRNKKIKNCTLVVKSQYVKSSRVENYDKKRNLLKSVQTQPKKPTIFRGRLRILVCK